MESEVISTFFSKEFKKPGSPLHRNPDDCKETSISEDLSEDFLHIADELNVALEQINLPSTVDCIYNPTIYARHTFEMYVKKYCSRKKHIMYFGMNPGPWGMSQTGVPFGEISSVRDWLGIEGPVGKPPTEIVARPIKGFECQRTEISGKRFWGLFKAICGTPENFFKSSFVYNYLPQQWMKKNGCNVTPGDLKSSQVEVLYNICDPVFAKVLKLYDVKTIVAVGKFCETRAQKTVKKYLPSSNIEILYLPHPSPRTVNNNDWDKKAVACLKKLNLLQYYKRGTN